MSSFAEFRFRSRRGNFFMYWYVGMQDKSLKLTKNEFQIYRNEDFVMYANLA